MKKNALLVITVFVFVNVSYAQWTQNGSSGNYYLNSGNAGINTTAITNKLTIYDNNTSTTLFRTIKDSFYDELGLYNYSNTDYYRTDLGFRRARGSFSAPLATQNNDWIGALNFWAANSAATFTNPSASVIGEVDGTPRALFVPGKIVFQTSDGTATTIDRMVIRYNGNVLIGQSTQVNSVYKLDVKGYVRADQIVVNTTGADFVFRPGYKLISLPGLERYIDQNHHLPDIASAADMQDNGLNVGENQIKLLQKIEELTLYLIEKNNQIAKEQAQLKEQQEKITMQNNINQMQSAQLSSQQEQINLLKQQMAEISKKLK